MVSSLELSVIVANLLVIISIYVLLRKPKVLAALLIWFSIAVFLGQMNFFKGTSFFIPNIGLMVVPIFIGIKFLSIFNKAPVHWIMVIQFFRVMGLSFLTLYGQQLMPGEFALPAGYGDAIIGITAPLVAYLYFTRKVKTLAIVWNFAGLADLVLSIILGFFTSPTPYQLLAFDLPNDPLFSFPLSLVPTFAVPVSLLLHLAALRIISKSN